jgi:hypothetical protein
LNKLLDLFSPRDQERGNLTSRAVPQANPDYFRRVTAQQAAMVKIGVFGTIK